MATVVVAAGATVVGVVVGMVAAAKTKMGRAWTILTLAPPLPLSTTPYPFPYPYPYPYPRRAWTTYWTRRPRACRTWPPNPNPKPKP